VAGGARGWGARAVSAAGLAGTRTRQGRAGEWCRLAGAAGLGGGGRFRVDRQAGYGGPVPGAGPAPFVHEGVAGAGHGYDVRVPPIQPRSESARPSPTGECSSAHRSEHAQRWSAVPRSEPDCRKPGCGEAVARLRARGRFNSRGKTFCVDPCSPLLWSGALARLVANRPCVCRGPSRSA
jgi:hypothetical protein